MFFVMIHIIALAIVAQLAALRDIEVDVVAFRETAWQPEA